MARRVALLEVSVRTKLLQTFAVSVAMGIAGCGGSADKSTQPSGSDAAGATSVGPTGGGGSLQNSGSAGNPAAAAGAKSNATAGQSASGRGATATGGVGSGAGTGAARNNG